MAQNMAAQWYKMESVFSNINLLKKDILFQKRKFQNIFYI